MRLVRARTSVCATLRTIPIGWSRLGSGSSSIAPTLVYDGKCCRIPGCSTCFRGLATHARWCDRIQRPRSVPVPPAPLHRYRRRSLGGAQGRSAGNTVFGRGTLNARAGCCRKGMYTSVRPRCLRGEWRPAVVYLFCSSSRWLTITLRRGLPANPQHAHLEDLMRMFSWQWFITFIWTCPEKVDA